VPLQPQMRIYDESNPNQFIEKNEDDIMKKFTNFLEKNPKEAHKLLSSNVKISYNISQRNELSLSFKFEDKTSNAFASSDSSQITFINQQNQQFKTQKSESIIKIETVAKTQKEAEEKANKEAEEKAKREAEEKAKREAEEKAKREAEEKAKREAEEKAKREAEERVKREAEERVKREAEEKAKKEAEEKAKREAEEKAKKEAEDRISRKTFTKITKEVDEFEAEVEMFLKTPLNQNRNPTDEKLTEGSPQLKIIEAVNKTSTIASAQVESKTKIHQEAAEITKIDEIRIIIQSIIDSAQSTQQSRLSALNLIESTDLTPSKSAIALMNRLTSFDCARSPKKENNFYEILTTNPEARSSLIDYLAEYDIDEKKIKHGSLVRLLIDKKESFTKSDVLIEKSDFQINNDKIMQDLVIDLGLKMLSNLEVQEGNLKKSNGKIEEFASKTRLGRLDFSDELSDHENLAQNTEAQKRVQALTEKNIETINKKLKDFFERTGYTEESLKKMIEERSSNPQSNPAHAEILSATQTNVRS
jgi:hypothetical protein